MDKEVKLIYDVPVAKIKFIQYAKDVGWELSLSGQDLGACVLEVLDVHEGLLKRFKKAPREEP